MRVTTLNIEGKNYPLVFSLNAGEKIEEAYVSVENLGDVLINPKKYGCNGISVVKDVVYILIEEGIEYCNFKKIRTIKKKSLELKLPQKSELFKCLDYQTMTPILNAIRECIIGSKKNK